MGAHSRIVHVTEHGVVYRTSVRDAPTSRGSISGKTEKNIQRKCFAGSPITVQPNIDMQVAYASLRSTRLYRRIQGGWVRGIGYKSHFACFCCVYNVPNNTGKHFGFVRNVSETEKPTLNEKYAKLFLDHIRGILSESNDVYIYLYYSYRRFII